MFAFGPWLPSWRFCSCLFPRLSFFPLAHLVCFKLEHLIECISGGSFFNSWPWLQRLIPLHPYQPKVDRQIFFGVVSFDAFLTCVCA
jgi:hypothetical protein